MRAIFSIVFLGAVLIFDRRASGAPPVGQRDRWAVEDAAPREKLPLYKTIPAERSSELTSSVDSAMTGGLRTWTRSHGDAGSRRYSALDQITKANVAKLEMAWTYNSKDGKANIQCNPIIVRGVMYAPTAGDFLAAVNAETGAEIWRFKPDAKLAFRGLTFWPGKGGSGERIYFPTEGGWMYAVDPASGKPIAGFGEAGRVRLPQGARVAPVIFDGLLIIAGYGKDVEAFDAVTGAHQWSFHTIPRDGEPGRETWDEPDEGANCWGGMALDEARGMVFITLGSPKPNFHGSNHAGDNLYGDCVLALDARTGKKRWHFQEIRHDIWDLDIPAPPCLTTITREGRKVDVVAAVTKIGNTLILDRVTGKPVFPFRMRRAPVSDLPGEVTAPYQPDLQLPEPFARQEFKLEDVTQRTEEAHEFVLNRVKGGNYGWFRPFSLGRPTVLYGFHGGAEWTGACVDPASGRLYVSANEIPWIVTVFSDDEPPFDPAAKPTEGELVFRKNCAQCHGENRIGIGMAPPLRGLRHRLKDADVLALLKTGRNAMPVPPPMTESEQKALLDFLFLRDRPGLADSKREERPRYSHNGYPKLLDHENYPGVKPPWGTLNCIDLNNGKLLWKVPLGEYEELTKQGIPKTGTENFGGAIVTAGGLVFCSGTRDGCIRAFDTETGAELWKRQLPFCGTAPPSTYEWNGRQYVVVVASGGGKLGMPTGDAYVAFALPDGKAQ